MKTTRCTETEHVWYYVILCIAETGSGWANDICGKNEASSCRYAPLTTKKRVAKKWIWTNSWGRPSQSVSRVAYTYLYDSADSRARDASTCLSWLYGRSIHYTHNYQDSSPCILINSLRTTAHAWCYSRCLALVLWRKSTHVCSGILRFEGVRGTFCTNSVQ